MNGSRVLLRWISAGLLFFLSLTAQADEVRMLVQSSPLAGFQYHAGAELWDKLQVGDKLKLIREPDNAHDVRAVRVEWQGHQLGYLPRAENRAVAAEMDRGTRVEGRIAKLVATQNPWQRLLIDVYVVF